eukprot:scaffold20.g7884.t1
MASNLFVELQRLQQILEGEGRAEAASSRAPAMAAFPGSPVRRSKVETTDTELEDAVEVGIVSTYKAQLAQAQAEVKSLKKQLKKALQENTQLGETVALLRGDVEALRQQLKQSAGEAACSEEATHATKEVAEHWRERHADAAAQLAAASEAQAVLGAENRELRRRLELAEGALEEERRAHLHTEDELERLLLGVSTALRVGPLPEGSSPRKGCAPQLPRRCALGLTSPAADASAKADGPPAAAEWRKQLGSTMQAFEDRRGGSKKLQAELSDVRQQMEALACG